MATWIKLGKYASNATMTVNADLITHYTVADPGGAVFLHFVGGAKATHLDGDAAKAFLAAVATEQPGAANVFAPGGVTNTGGGQ